MLIDKGFFKFHSHSIVEYVNFSLYLIGPVYHIQL